MDIAILVNAGIDYQGGVRRLGGNNALYETLLMTFLEDKNFQGAKELLKTPDDNKFYAHIHELKGVSGNLSMTNLFDSSRKILQLIKDGDYDKIENNFAAFEEVYLDVINAIKKAGGSANE